MQSKSRVPSFENVLKDHLKRGEYMKEIDEDLRDLEERVSARKLELEGRLDLDMSENLKGELHERVEQLGKVHEGLEIAIKGLEPIW